MGKGIRKLDHRARVDVSALETAIPAVLFKSVETVCRDALRYGGNHPALRNDINQLIQQMRAAAAKRFGLDTPDIVSLTDLLRKTDPNEEKQHKHRVSIDPLQYLYDEGRLREEHITTARDIRALWSAFRRYTDIAGQNLTGSRSGRGTRMLAPQDILGEDAYEIYQTKYLPWVALAKQRGWVGRGQQRITAASVVISVVVEEVHAVQVDQAYEWPTGRTVAVLQQELCRFEDPTVRFENHPLLDPPPKRSPAEQSRPDTGARPEDAAAAA